MFTIAGGILLAVFALYAIAIILAWIVSLPDRMAEAVRIHRADRTQSALPFKPEFDPVVDLYRWVKPRVISALKQAARQVRPSRARP